MVCYLILKLRQAVNPTDTQTACVLRASSYFAEKDDYQRYTVTSKSTAIWETKYRF